MPSRGRKAAGLVHVGVALVLVSLTLAEAFSRSGRVVLGEGESADTVGLTVRHHDRQTAVKKNYLADVARVEVSRQGAPSVFLSPELRLYRDGQELIPELAVHSGFAEDVLVALTATSQERVALVVRRRPGVLWIWVGGALMVLAGACLAWTRRPPVTED